MPTTPQLLRVPTLAPLCLCLLTMGAAHAESNPYYLGASLGVTSDSNVRRARDGAEQSDTIASGGLRAGIDQPMGRSRLVVDLAANHNQYNRLKDYNHSDYSLLGRLDWETVERLSGTFAADARQSLYRDTSRADTSRNLLRSEGLSFQARLGVVTMWSFDAGLSANRSRYSSAAYRSANLDQQSVNAGVRFAPSADLSTRLTLRHTNARYPEYSATQADKVKRDDIELGATLRASGASTLDARISRTSESHSVVTQRDLNSWTGAMSWNWQASGKTGIGLTLSRDSTVGAYGDLGLPVNDTSDARLRNMLTLRTQWEASSKIRLNATVAYARRTLDDALATAVSGVTQVTTDTTTTVGLGLAYQPLRNLELGCGVNWENRTVSNELSTLTYPYSDTSFNCYGQVFLR